jgi:hypothetical protein
MTHPTEQDFEEVSDAEIRRRFLRLVRHSAQHIDLINGHDARHMSDTQLDFFGGQRDALRTVQRMMMGEV